jgi:hypothetical protein
VPALGALLIVLGVVRAPLSALAIVVVLLAFDIHALRRRRRRLRRA